MDLLNELCCLGILGFGVIVAGMLAVSGRRFEHILEAFERIEKVTNAYSEDISQEGDVMKISSSVVDYDRKLLEENRIRFNEQYARYVVCSQLISLFPLLGILGTVLGLVLNQDPTNVEQLVSGLSVALWTTLIGLVCSIILKFTDSVFPGKLVNDIDAKFSTVDGAINRQILERVKSSSDDVQ